MRLGVLLGYLGLAVAAVVCLFAIVRGGPEERRAGIIVGLGWAASYGLQRVTRALDPFVSLAVVDFIAFLALAAMVWRRRWVWPTVAVAFQGLAVSTDLVRMAAPTTHRWAYLTTLAIAGYGLLGTLLFATATRGGRVEPA